MLLNKVKLNHHFREVSIEELPQLSVGGVDDAPTASEIFKYRKIVRGIYAQSCRQYNSPRSWSEFRRIRMSPEYAATRSWYHSLLWRSWRWRTPQERLQRAMSWISPTTNHSYPTFMQQLWLKIETMIRPPYGMTIFVKQASESLVSRRRTRLEEGIFHGWSLFKYLF